LNTHIGRVAGVEEIALPAHLVHWDCRNNRLAWLGLQQDGFLDRVRTARERYGSERVAVILGTSTSSIGSSEDAYRERTSDTELPAEYQRPIIHTPHSLVDFVRHALDLHGPFLTVATACSSSARVFGSAERMIRLGLVDAAVVGGVDSLCLSVLYGFNALELVSSEVCRPFDATRSGLNIGEAAGFALLERAAGKSPVLQGYGESSDAYHMSSPHPEGLGAQRAMQTALARGRLTPADIDYVNLHGTATRMNDEIEGRAVHTVFERDVACSSTKGWTGHTLGAAGIVEAVISLLSLERSMIPATLNSSDSDTALANSLAFENIERPLRHVMSNSFGFGGNNCTLVFGKAA
jgi:3-oxoacyl-[acyl-carrier-protein] synthase-1